MADVASSLRGVEQMGELVEPRREIRTVRAASLRTRPFGFEEATSIGFGSARHAVKYSTRGAFRADGSFITTTSPGGTRGTRSAATHQANRPTATSPSTAAASPPEVKAATTMTVLHRPCGTAPITRRPAGAGG